MKKNHGSQKNRFIQWIIDIDYRSAKWFYTQNPKLIPLLKIISLLGTIQFWVILGILMFIIGVFFDQSIENFSVLMFMGVIVSLSTISILKIIVKRKRPYQDQKLREITNQEFVNREPYISKAQQSFPSGHMFYWLMEFVFFYYHFGPWVLIPFLTILPLIFTSRIYLGVHFLSDVLVGSLMGILFGFLTHFVFDMYILPLYIKWVAVFF